jgi:phosphoglycolate phosphatase
MLFLILWDIDGTLISSGGAGMRALRTGLSNAFGISDLLEDIDYAGRTDRWIMRQIFSKFRLPATEENFTRLADAYLAALPSEMRDPRAKVLPGVKSLLATLGQSKHIAQGLLTGNLERGAKVKLGHHGIWEHFPFGAFADDSELRNELGPHALRRAGARHGVVFPPERVWIIGDTPHDIECARVIGANSLAVATGLHTVEALAAHRPTAVMADLSDAEAFWNLTALRPAHPPAP